VIRGALVFGAGLALGYAKAVSETEAINQTVNNIVVKTKQAWEDASTDRPTPDEPKDIIGALGLDRDGVEHLLKRLYDALPAYPNADDKTVVISDEGGVDVITIGDLRAPFQNLDTHTNTQGETAQ
jgi:hypothetical protein